MSVFEDSTQYENAAQQAPPMRSRAYSVYDDQTQPQQQTSASRASVSLYPSDTVQGSSRRTSHFPRVPDVTFSQQQQQQQGHPVSQAGSPTLAQQPQQSRATAAGSKKFALDPRPMNLLALDPSFYAVSSSVPTASVATAGSQMALSASASVPPASQQQQNPLAQASAAVALTALAGKRLFT